MRATGVISLLALAALGGCAPAALTPDEIVPAFIAASQDAARTMRMEWQGTVAMGQGEDPDFDPSGLNQTISATFDFNGPDFAGTINSGNEGDSTSISYATVRGVSFINYSNSGWQRNDSIGGTGAAPELDPMHGLTAADVAYEALDDLDGRQVHRLRILDPLAVLSGSLFDQSVTFGSEFTLNGPSDYLIYVDANGIPVGAEMALVLGMSVNLPDLELSDVTYEMHFSFTFNLWGEPVTISPPEVTGGGFDEPAPPPGIK